VEKRSLQLGISAFAWTSKFKRSHLDILPGIKAMGLSAVEIPMFDPTDLAAADIRAVFEENGLDCTVCAILPQAQNPISPDAAARKRAINHLTRCVEAAAKMGAKLLGGPLFAPIGYLPDHRPNKNEWLWAAKAFQALKSVLEDNDMVLSLEPVNRSETFFLRTAAEAERLCELIGDSRIGVTIDTFHANIEELNIADAIISLGAHLMHLHASENDRGPLGRGHIPFSEIVSALQAINYRGYLMIEGFGYSAKEKNAPGRLWASTDVSPEALATESAQHLRSVSAKAQ
jgi:D-psicose/D-tagatose/L-ribulose 3-epimerase